jgi:small-conductance mechanosensitive channel
VLMRVGHRLARRTAAVADTAFLNRTRGSGRLLLVLLALSVVMPSMPAPGDVMGPLRHVLSLALIGTVTWVVIRAVMVADDVVRVRFDVNVADNLRARRIHTQTRVITRSVMIIAGVIGASAMLMTFPTVRQLGASILASAGLAGLIVGLAARATIANLLAGLQIALTQPITLDDVVIVQGEWGRIEQITSTYVVVRIWDQRRLIVPLNWFIENPFQNWTRRTADILGTVFIYTDYTVPVDAVRAELERIVKSSDKWDGRVCGVQVTDARERTLEVRALVSAADSGSAWDLRCEVREKLVGFLQREYPGSLPRVRIETEDEARAAGAAE